MARHASLQRQLTGRSPSQIHWMAQASAHLDAGRGDLAALEVRELAGRALLNGYPRPVGALGVQRLRGRRNVEWNPGRQVRVRVKGRHDPGRPREDALRNACASYRSTLNRSVSASAF